MRYGVQRIGAVVSSGLVLLCVALLAGCGSSPGGGGTGGTIDPSVLNGNWLLEPSSSPIALSTNNAALTLSVTGNNIAGIASVPCAAYSIEPVLIAPVAGTVNADGSFTLTVITSSQTSLSPPINLQLSGNITATTTTTWSATLGYQIAQGAGCTGTAPTPAFASQAVTAHTMPLLSGTFVGTLPLTTKGTAAPTTLTLSLTQGGTVNGSTTAPYLASYLSGSATATPTTCFSSGTVLSLSTTPVASSAVGGTEVLLVLQMSDGSQLQLLGIILKPDASQFSINGELLGGNCGTSSLGPVFTATFQKQP